MDYDVRRQIVVAPIKPEFTRLNGQDLAPKFHPGWADAHTSDILRMNILRSMGGIYLDTDVLVLRSFDELRRASHLTMGLQTFTKMCNGVILSSPSSAFLKDWYDGLYTANFTTCWDCHSIELPSRLWAAQRARSSDNASAPLPGPARINVLPIESFFDPSFSRSDLHELFREQKKGKRLFAPYSGKYAVHLWNRVRVATTYLAAHRLEHICSSDSMYNEMLRFALNGTVFLERLCAQ